jgi:hypothetical protein
MNKLAILLPVRCVSVCRNSLLQASCMAALVGALATSPLSANPILETPDVTFIGASPADRLGSAVEIGDFDGNGQLDIAVFASQASPLGRAGVGIIYVLWNSATLSGLTDLASYPGPMSVVIPRPGDFGATSRIAVGDINGDNLDDIVLGVPCVANGASCIGSTYVVYGSAAFPDTVDLVSPPIPVTTILGDDIDNGYLGAELTVGDFDGDEIDDVIVAAPFLLDTGMVYVVYGAFSMPGTIDLYTGTTGITRITDSQYGVGLGRSLACSDVNADGTDDMLVGAPGNAFGTFDGKATLILGSPTPPDTIVVGGKGASGQFKLTASNGAEGTLGSQVALGDFDGDGSVDAAVSAHNRINPSCTATPCGRVYIVSHLSGLAPTTNLDIPSPSVAVYDGGAFLLMGRNIAAGDLNADGKDDLALAGDEELGTVAVIWGPPGFGESRDISADSLTTLIIADDPTDRFGYDLLASDMSGDGIADLLIGARRADPMGRPDAGELCVFMGSSTASAVGTTNPALANLRVFPNPSSGLVTLFFAPSKTSQTSLSIYDVRGRHVRTLVEGRAVAGAGSVAWDGTGARGEKVPAGVYFVRMISGAHEVTRRIVLLR